MLQSSNNNIIEFKIHGRIPSKKNSRNIFVRGGKLFNIPSKKYKEWHNQASEQLLTRIPDEPYSEIDTIELFFYAPDKRAADLTNKAESIMDLLVDNNVIVDDNWYNVNRIMLKFMGLDRENPRCTIVIHQKEEQTWIK